MLLCGLTQEFESGFIESLKSILCANICNSEYITTKYRFGALNIKEEVPSSLKWNTMKDVSDETYYKLLKHWKLIDFDILLTGWFRENCSYFNEFPHDIILFMKVFCCIPSVDVNSYKMQCINSPKNIMNLWNISSIYRKCWSLTNNKECFRHKELSYCFKKSLATMFIVNLACYDQIDVKTGGNKMNRTIKLYQWFLKDYSLYLKKHRIKHGNVLLIFDRIDSFKTKLLNNNVSINECCSFEKYGGPPYDFIACKEYIIYKFKALNLYSNIKLDLYFNDNDKNHQYLSKIEQLW